MSASLPACSLFGEGNATALLTHHSSLLKICLTHRDRSTGLKIKGRSKAALPVLQLLHPPTGAALSNTGCCVKRERMHKDSDKKYFKTHKLQMSLLVNPSTQYNSTAAFSTLPSGCNNAATKQRGSPLLAGSGGTQFGFVQVRRSIFWLTPILEGEKRCFQLWLLLLSIGVTRGAPQGLHGAEPSLRTPAS